MIAPTFSPIEHLDFMQMRRIIARLCYDDSLLFTNWVSVERLYLERGTPHYRVFSADVLLGVVRVWRPTMLVTVQAHLAHVLLALGCRPTTALLLDGGAQTPMDASMRALPVLRYSVSLTIGNTRSMLSTV